MVYTALLGGNCARKDSTAISLKTLETAATTFAACKLICDSASSCIAFDHKSDNTACYSYTDTAELIAGTNDSTTKCYIKKDISDWTHVRHTPSTTEWHKANDKLAGT